MNSSSTRALELAIDGLCYRLDRVPDPNGDRVVLSVAGLEATSTGQVLRDRVDLYALRGRHTLAQHVANVFRLQRRQVLSHLNVLLDQIERVTAQEPTTDPLTTLTEPRRSAATKLLRRPDLLERAAASMETLGYVGEDRAKRLGYLVATSRLLRKPLSAILQAPSGSGKSELLEVLATLLPPEQVEYLSRLTTHALYYAGPDHLRHKLVIVDEQAGASESDYAIRTLQSKGLLRLALPVKGKTEHFEARGPIALMSGTTSSNLNPENLSRCLQLTLDSSPEQTKRIQEAQRAAWSGKQRRRPSLEAWQDAQRLVETLEVVIPLAPQLSFPVRTTHDRGLIAAHALLHQHQRDRDRAQRLVATPADYQVVHGLLAPSLEEDVGELSPRAARLYRALVLKEAGPLTRREAAGLLDGSYNTAKRALEELVAHELVAQAEAGPPRRYRVLDESAIGPVGGLLDRLGAPLQAHTSL